jgi:MFS family permease
VTPRQDRQRLFGLQFMCLNLGLSVGGLIGAVIANVADPSSFVLLYLLDAATFVVYLAILLPMRGVGVGPSRASSRESDDEGESAPVPGAPPSGYRTILRDRAAVRLMIGSILLLTFGYGSLEVGLPVYITQVAGLDLSMVGLAYAVNAGSIVIGQIFVLSLIQGRSRSVLGTVVGLLWAASWLAIGASALVPMGWAIALILVGMLVFAFGETIWSPVAPAIANDLAPDHLRGRYNAIMSWSWALSGTLGPGLTGLLLGAGHAAAWLVLVLAGLLAAAAVIASLRRVLTPMQDGRA